MSSIERVVADYEGTGLTIGPHPMAMRREEMSLRGALRASDLPRQRHGRRVRVAGAVITRQRPGTAKGFVFLTLEDETGIANIIIRPDLFAEQRLTVINEPFLLVEGILQNQEGVTSVRAERMTGSGDGRWRWSRGISTRPRLRPPPPQTGYGAATARQVTSREATGARAAEAAPRVARPAGWGILPPAPGRAPLPARGRRLPSAEAERGAASGR